MKKILLLALAAIIMTSLAVRANESSSLASNAKLQYASDKDERQCAAVLIYSQLRATNYVDLIINKVEIKDGDKRRNRYASFEAYDKKGKEFKGEYSIIMQLNTKTGMVHCSVGDALFAGDSRLVMILNDKKSDQAVHHIFSDARNLDDILPPQNDVGLDY